MESAWYRRGGDHHCGMIFGNTMSTTKVAISIDQRLLRRVDTLVRQKAFASRSRAIQQAVEEKLARLDRSRLARECAKLEPGPSRPKPTRASNAISPNGPNTERRDPLG